MKNKKIITATIITLLAPTLLNCQVVLAEATNSQEASVAPEVTTDSETNEGTTSTSEKVVTPETSQSQQTTESSVSPEVSETQSSATASSESTSQSTELGKDAIDSKNITVLDPEVGDVTINVLPTKTITKGKAFNPMQGVTAYDNVAKKDITKDLKIESIQFGNSMATVSTPTTAVDTNTEGFYFITYTVTTENGTAKGYSLVLVVGEEIGMYTIEIPDLILPKNADLANAIDSSAVVKDHTGKVVPKSEAELFIGGQYSTSETGTFAVEVGILSEYNSITTKTVNVTIVDPVKINATDKEFFVGDTFDATKYATATSLDGNGTTINLPVTVVSNDVDTTTPGNYTVVYEAKDSLGNKATKTVKITVSEKPAAKASVTAENHVMYVGDKLTEDMVMSWATFENIDEYEYGFEVVGDSIRVTEPGNKLIDAGTHKIRYYATNGKDTVETFITLDVRASRYTSDDDNFSGTVAPTENNNNLKNPVKAPVKEIKKKSEKQLPKTGTQESSMTLTAVGLSLIASVYFMKKRKENEFDLY